MKPLDWILAAFAILVFGVLLSPWGKEIRHQNQVRRIEQAQLDFAEEIEKAECNGVNVAKVFEEMGLLEIRE